ncbi:SURF1 family protein [Rhodophyticola sp. CCM32]|nr:SURF1 family protein [Rhodophyticola sp. CCM32]QBY02859.1 SURF1 family protein [Rhodophyticola sp. CCM32]
MIWPLVFGIGGAAILVALGVWQVQRLAWKEAVLADIDARIMAAPMAIPDQPDSQADRYLPVEAEGVIGDTFIRVLVSQRRIGAGYRVISPFETGGRVVLLDRGFIPVAEDLPAAPEGRVTVIGNLHWPDEVTGATPVPDLEENIWFARDVPALAEALGTAPILIIARNVSETEGVLTPLPVDTSGIPNDHLSYAITWFSLALIWLGMTLYLLWRIRQRMI